ncbi:MAG: T9SS type A sorting domain-containing protein, partial [Saprospiraceae bacterium]|nr:T9SS type A sorting domain-containing protein [Saprospiraceae bacterium]
CVRVKVVNNTIYEPENWVIRILQETTEPGFLSCSDNEFRNNIIYLSQDLTEVNIGPNTQPATFIFTNNLWYNASSNSWSPALPVTDSNQVLGDPLLNNPTQEDFSIPPSSPAVGAGINLPEPLSDFVMNSYYAPPSIGAFEGHESTTTAPYLIDENSIKMGPNPFSEAVKIDGDFSNATILILDSNGQILQDLSNSSAPLTIELNTLPDGLYFIQISSVNKPSMSVRRILKMTK